MAGVQGEITTWNYKKGFGWATRTDAPEVFYVHIKDLEGQGHDLKSLHVGTRFRCTLEESGKEKGKQRQAAKKVNSVEVPDSSQVQWKDGRVTPSLSHTYYLVDNNVKLLTDWVCDWGGMPTDRGLPIGTKVRYVESLGERGEPIAQWVSIRGWPQADEPEDQEPPGQPAAPPSQDPQLRSWPDEMGLDDMTKLKDAGYDTLGEAMRFKRSQEAWREFAGRIGLKDRWIEELACNFGSSVQTFLMDKQRALAQLLVEELGAHFDKATPNMKDDMIQINWLMHDTLKKTMDERIRVEGCLKPFDADDGYYDGDLAMNAAPKVVFFQASQKGLDPSIYPRLWKPEDGPKCRALVPPRNLALHTDAFRMYFVSIVEPRAKDMTSSGSQGLLQMHILFIPSDHVCIQFCDAHFLLVNKKTFQPYHHSDGKWVGFGGKNKCAFRGRGVKINVCVAQSLPFPGFYETTSIQRVLSLGLGGVVRPSHGGSEPTVGCHYWAEGNCKHGEACKFYHDPVAVL